MTTTITLLLYTAALALAMGLSRYAFVQSSKRPMQSLDGHLYQGAAPPKLLALMVVPVPCLLFGGVTGLLVHAGIPLAWALSSLVLAFASTALGVAMLNTKNVRTYENGWGLMAYLSLPGWVVLGAIVGLVMLLV